MLELDSVILETAYNGLQVMKLKSSDSCEVLLISLEKNHQFPEHTSPRDALLVVLEGVIEFSIKNKNYSLQKHHTFQFPGKVPHKVYARENSKFLIIR